MEIHIVGFADHWTQTPWGRSGAEYWGMNKAYRAQPIEKFDKWFELHRIDTMYRNYPGQEDERHIEWLQTQTQVEVVAWSEEIGAHRIKHAVDYPLSDVLKMVEPWRYFTNSVTWMIAMAVWTLNDARNLNSNITPDKIGLWGIDMATEKEHRRERPSVEWMLGYALASGYELELPPQCDLLRAPGLYGYDQHRDLSEKVRAYKAGLNEDLDAIEERFERARAKRYMIKGALDAVEYLERAWVEKPEEVEFQVEASGPGS